MSKKHIVDMLSNYFDELLVEPDDSEISSDRSATDSIFNKPEITNSKKVTTNEALAHSIPQKETISETRSEKTQTNERNCPISSQRPYEPKLQHNQSQILGSDKNIAAIDKKPMLGTAHRFPIGNPVDNNEKLIAVTAPTHYEKSKQQLEKILQQVTVLNDDSQVAPLLTSTKIEPSVGKEIETNIITDDHEVLVELESCQPLPPLTSEWLENGRPNWAQEQFDILLIEVNGLKLALPLMALGQIYSLEDNLTPLFGQSDWFMGLQKTPTANVKTVNTAKFVMPERYEENDNYQYVVSINGSSWGLAVDSIHQPINIDPNHIRWRSKRDNRPWMAGMVKDHMCVLLDIPVMEEMLQKQDKNNV